MANTKQARVLTEIQLDGVTYKANQVIDADANVIQSGVEGGVLDASTAAVDYCLSQGVKPKHHKKGKSSPADKTPEMIKADAENKVKELTAALTKASQKNKPSVQAKLDAAKAALEALG